MITLTVTGPYTYKDQAKASRANKFIGRGSARSSTNSYANDFKALANSGVYSKDDIVFVSAEGARGGRLSPDYAQLQLAINAGATFVTDVLSQRSRAYNVGEREVAHYLATHGYCESLDGTWTPVDDNDGVCGH